jgi:hypothetical protein
MSRKIIFALGMIIIMAIFLLAGCGANTSQETSEIPSVTAPDEGESAESAESSGEPPTADQVMGRADQNKDGKVTREEYQGPPAWFESFDKNKDGVIDEKEFPTAGTPLPPLPPPSADSIMERFDTNKDGEITREEFESGRGPAPFFERLDQNKDGIVTMEELRQGMQAMPKTRPSQAGESAESAESAE